MQTLCIIPCGSKKIWDKEPDLGPQKAGDVYIGSFHRKCKEYAMKFHQNSWCILSAKHGFLFPTDIVPSQYNVSFNLKRSNLITLGELSKQMYMKELEEYKKIVVLGGKNYTKIIEEVFYSAEVLNPLSGCKGIGYMMQRLNKLIDK